MKLHFSALLASIVAANSVSAERDLQAIFDDPADTVIASNYNDAGSMLYERWYQDVPVIGYVPETNIFTLDFVSSSPDNTKNNMDAIFYDEGCRWDGETTGFTEFVVLPPDIYSVTADPANVNALDHALAEMVPDANNINRPRLQFKLDPALLAKKSQIYTLGDKVVEEDGTVTTEGNGVLKGTAAMKICVRTSLGYGTDENPGVDVVAKVGPSYIRQNTLATDPHYQEVNFIEHILTVNYDLSAGFDVAAFAVEPKLRVETTATKKNVYKLVAYLCQLFNGEIQLEAAADAYPIKMPLDLTADFVPDPTGSPLGGVGGKGTQANAKAFNQGSLITVCVMPDVTAYGEGIRMNGLTTFDWVRLPPPNNQEAIVNSGPSGNFLTSYIHGGCTDGKDFCHFSSVLFADFYRSKGAAQGSGTAQIMFETRRRLGEKEVRKLEEDEDASEFGLEVQLDDTDEGPGALKTAGGASFGFTVMVSAVALASAALMA